MTNVLLTKHFPFADGSAVTASPMPLPLTMRPETTMSERHSCARFRQPFVAVISLEVISYLKLSGSRLSSRPSAVSA